MTELFGDPAAFLQRLVLQVPALLIAVTVHELAHALLADRLGDPTARRLGRITLNPLPHIDPLGAIAFVIAGFGWAKPVPVNAANLAHPRRDMALVAAAGPLSNFLVAFVALAALRTLASWGLIAARGDSLAQMLLFIYYFNIGIGVFNLIPLPPLDGGHFLPYLLPPRAAHVVRALEQYGAIILLLLVFSGAFRWIIRPVIQWVDTLMVTVVRSLI
jgi:Zn-dependent protease